MSDIQWFAGLKGLMAQTSGIGFVCFDIWVCVFCVGFLGGFSGCGDWVLF